MLVFFYKTPRFCGGPGKIAAGNVDFFTAGVRSGFAPAFSRCFLLFLPRFFLFLLVVPVTGAVFW